ncbi:ComEC/Rec2 family competence protein [Bacteroides heparinolyticus]|uniref:ComEC/Rec2 family competence protein n=1 Tax=Prevotella heparinolytica TaxID=28113 RepID=UPI0035A07D3A
MKKTRFRAYQLGEKGSSFSYSVDNHFTLIEGRFNEVNKANVLSEMECAGATRVSCLHITSWDEDHCKESELRDILNELKPLRIEYPGYEPDSDCGKACKKLIQNYCVRTAVVSKTVTPDYINGLTAGQNRQYNDILYNPTEDHTSHNDNSIVKLFRQGRFTLLSLGDCENSEIAKAIEGCSIASTEVDVMILAHHGADNGFTTEEFVNKINPRVAICSSNYDNQFEHPRQEVRNILYNHEPTIPLYTTKTGDVVITCNEDNDVHVYNLISNSRRISSEMTFRPKLTVAPKYD